MIKRFFQWIFLFGCLSLLGAVNIKDVSVTPRWSWNGLVDIVYSVECDDEEGILNLDSEVILEFWIFDKVRQREIPLTTLTGDGVGVPVKVGGPYHTVWNAAMEKVNFLSEKLTLQIHGEIYKDDLCLIQSEDLKDASYIVVDLSGGMNASKYPVRYSTTEPDVSNDACRTTELWLRRISAGTFTMGSLTDELGRGTDETQHQVTLNQDFYIGVFEVTQRQWELVMGTRPSYFSNNDCYATRPVEKVSYDMIRGSNSTEEGGWPKYGHTAEADSFMGKIRAKTGLTFDLPTEAQWEYACRKRADGSYGAQH